MFYLDVLFFAFSNRIFLIECIILKLYLIGSIHLWALLEIFVFEKENIKKKLGFVGKVTSCLYTTGKCFCFAVVVALFFALLFSFQPWFWIMICSIWIQLHTKHASSGRRTKRRFRLFWKPDDKRIYRPATDSYYRLHGHHWRGRKVNLGRKSVIKRMTLMLVDRHKASVGKVTWSNRRNLILC